VKSYYSYLWGSQWRYRIDATLSALPASLQADVRMSQMADTVGQSRLFEGLSRGCLSHILSKLDRMVAMPGQMLCVRGTVGVDMFFIADGKVDVLVGDSSSGGRETVIASLGAGDTFGELACLFGTARSSSVRAQNYCLLYVLELEELEEAFELFDHAQTIVEGNARRAKARMELQEKNLSHVHMVAGDNAAASRRNKLQQLMQPLESEQADSPSSRAWTISPNDRRYVAWETAHVLFVLWNSAMTPLLIAFEPHSTNPFVLAISYLGDVVMILDIALSFRVRFIKNGHEMSDVRDIRAHYLHGRFALHVLASLPLDLCMIATGIQPYLRLNRILRVYDVHDLINQRIRDSKYPDAAALIYLIVNLLFISHWCACIYWVLSLQAGFLEQDVKGWQPSSASANENNSVLDYLTALFWSMGLLVGYGSSYFPPNYLTTIFTLFIQLVGLFAISYLIAMLGNTAGTLQLAAAAASEEQTSVTEAFNFWRLPKDLHRRVDTYLKHRWSVQMGVDPNQALALLPSMLRTEIMFDICGALLRSVNRLRSLDDECLRCLAGELQFVEMPANEYVFFQGQLGNEMHFIARGSCEILRESGAAASSSPLLLKTVGAGTFVGEGALFTGVRAASLRCTTSTLLYSLTVAGFRRVMHQHPEFARSMLTAHEERVLRRHMHHVDAINDATGTYARAAHNHNHAHALGHAAHSRAHSVANLSPRSNGNGGDQAHGHGHVQLTARGRSRLPTAANSHIHAVGMDSPTSVSRSNSLNSLLRPTRSTKLVAAVANLLAAHPPKAKRQATGRGAQFSSVVDRAVLQKDMPMGSLLKANSKVADSDGDGGGSVPPAAGAVAVAHPSFSRKTTLAISKTASATRGEGQKSAGFVAVRSGEEDAQTQNQTQTHTQTQTTVITGDKKNAIAKGTVAADAADPPAAAAAAASVGVVVKESRQLRASSPAAPSGAAAAADGPTAGLDQLVVGYGPGPMAAAGGVVATMASVGGGGATPAADVPSQPTAAAAASAPASFSPCVAAAAAPVAARPVSSSSAAAPTAPLPLAAGAAQGASAAAAASAPAASASASNAPDASRTQPASLHPSAAVGAGAEPRPQAN
jgi:CRP-like cAMP-binding protein